MTMRIPVDEASTTSTTAKPLEPVSSHPEQGFAICCSSARFCFSATQPKQRKALAGPFNPGLLPVQIDFEGDL